MSAASELSRNLLKEVFMKFRTFSSRTFSSRTVAAMATAALVVVTLVFAFTASGQVAQKSKMPDPRTPMRWLGEGIVDGDLRVYRRRIQGEARNEDVYG